MNNYCYTFPAVKGLQANENYYICMVPLGLLLKLFPIDNDYVDPEYRAQRKLNLARIPEIKNYILSNRNSYVFSALCASFDGEFSFKPLDDTSNLGNLIISMNATFLINDGQHRRAAIKEAIIEDPTLQDETIPVVMFLDKGLSRSQQMFTDLNKHAINTTKSLNALYDSNDPLSVLTKKVVNSVPFLKKYTDKEKDNLGKFSSHLFTLNNIVNANKNITKSVPLAKCENFVIEYWKTVCNNINEFNDLEQHSLSKLELREQYIITQGVTISALGLLGNYILVNQINLDILQKLKNIDWKRSNSSDWLDRAINKKGRIVKNSTSIYLTYLQLKKILDFNLTKDELKMLKNSRLH